MTAERGKYGAHSLVIDRRYSVGAAAKLRIVSAL